MIEPKQDVPRNIDGTSKEERLEWLMEEYGHSVIRLAYTYVKQKQLAEDIAQDVFIKCYEKMDDFREESSYKTWLYRITVNKCKDFIKSWSYKNVMVTEFFSSKWRRIDTTAEMEMLVNEENQYIAEKVISLPIKLREVIILHYYEEMKIEEISSLINVNRNTVKSRMHRARSLLKNMLKGGPLDG
ncbi:sigma-70 family RNA polymerase sigma factor [Alkalihalobacillus sp. AL-G]|uniref:sigma-70 family RNA polymerase sigma factor n=1 Tax=Alkalihalobacillus sp. AL-G TaxID=2926399 RepID=UPI00272ABCDE|nr:sigma-70 family RNA polymerase sigma factor [Alkalihalobacillus sp. AL-G]WLD94254.1 sigma-70 family RNA polymerase sigma factor [Alkalihalobacillus sp. AL-G]